MNEETWRALQKHGIHESAELRLDFSHNARDEASAKSLKAVLEEQTDYEVTIASDGAMFRKSAQLAGPGSAQALMVPVSFPRTRRLK